MYYQTMTVCIRSRDFAIISLQNMCRLLSIPVQNELTVVNQIFFSLKCRSSESDQR